jgi:hypothetical protein
MKVGDDVSTAPEVTTGASLEPDEGPTLGVVILTDKQTYNVGDYVKVTVYILDTSPYDAENTKVILAIPSGNLKLVDNGGYSVTEDFEDIYTIDFGFIGCEEDATAELTFLAVGAGETLIDAYVTCDDIVETPDNWCNTTITIEGGTNPTPNNNVEKDNE